MTSIDFCPDTAHLAAAGGNVPAMIRKHHARISYVHLKGWRREPFAFTPLDEGDLDIGAVVRAPARYRLRGLDHGRARCLAGPARRARPVASPSFREPRLPLTLHPGAASSRRSTSRRPLQRRSQHAQSTTLMLACATLAFDRRAVLGAAYATDPDAALAALKTQVFSHGPNGEKPSRRPRTSS